MANVANVSKIGRHACGRPHPLHTSCIHMADKTATISEEEPPLVGQAVKHHFLPFLPRNAGQMAAT